jgi:hypothetical protein
MGNRRLGAARLDTVLQRAFRNNGVNAPYDADDEWGAVRPIMVPGAQRNLRMVALGQMHGFGFEDMADIPADGQTTAIWLREDENSAGIALVADDADFTDGAVRLTTGTAANDQAGFLTANKPFNCTLGKQWWVEASIKVEDIDTTEMFFGLIEQTYATGNQYATQAAAAGKDSIGFVKNVHTSGAIKVRQNVNTEADNDIDRTITPSITLGADTDVLTMGIRWDGVGSIEYYAGRAATGSEVGALTKVLTVTSPIPEASVNMALLLQLEQPAGAAETVLVNYIRGAWEI